MSPKRRPPRTVLELGLARAGFRKTRKALLFAVAWGTVEMSLGKRPTVEEYAGWWRESRATAFRELALWREVYPEWHTPTVLFDALGIERSQRGGLNAGVFPVPAVAS